MASETAAQLRALLETYYNCADRKDFAAIGACFAEQAVVTYHVGTPQELRIEGRPAIVAQLDEVVSRFGASTHVLANFHVDMAGSGPISVTHAIANILLNDRVLVRGLRYVDRFIEEDGAWRIVDRQHVPMWQYECTPAVPRIA